MYLHYNYILITVGSSKIGEELIEKLYLLENQLIVVSKSKSVLDLLRLKFPKINCIESDIAQAKSLHALVEHCNIFFPELDMVIHHDVDENDLKAKTISQELCKKTNQVVSFTKLISPLLMTKSNGVLVLTKIIPYATDESIEEENSCSLKTCQKALANTSLTLHYLPVKLRKTNTDSFEAKTYAKKLISKFITDLINDRVPNQNKTSSKADLILIRLRDMFIPRNFRSH